MSEMLTKLRSAYANGDPAKYMAMITVQEAHEIADEIERLRGALEPFRSGGEWGTIKAWIVIGSGHKQEGIDLAKRLTAMNAKADAALAISPPITRVEGETQ